MAVQVNISISAQAETAEEAQAIIDGLSGLPEGAMVSSTMSQPLTSGLVDANGNVVAPEPPA